MSTPLELGAIHDITGRQWNLSSAEEQAWPDITIVIPFNCRVIDGTGKVISPPISSQIQGGYNVIHTLNKIELFDLVHDKVVPDVKGVWAAGPSGDTARLHLLGQDPFSWLTPHTDAIEYISETPPRVVEQRFRYGPSEIFADERRFGEMLLKPAVNAELLTEFSPLLTTRIMSCNDFRLKFQTLAGATIHIDSLVLFLISFGRSEASLVSPESGPEAWLVSSVGSPRYIGEVKPLYGDLRLLAVEFDLPYPTDEITIKTTAANPVLVYSVLYRESRKYSTSWVKKTVLVPGKYRIIVEGNSTAEDASETEKLPPSKPVSWRIEKVFGVRYPESLRPYIHYTTLGDNRIFFDKSGLWNPTMYGFGFPVYRLYEGVVRFLVPYISQIFANIKMKVLYEKGTILVQNLSPKANPDGVCSLFKKSQDWIALAGGTVLPDEEIVFKTTYKEHGPAKVQLSFEHPDGTEVKLDEWSCYFSQFSCFREHLSWEHSHCLQTYYDATGRNVRPSCPIIEDDEVIHPILRVTSNRVDVLPVSTFKSRVDVLPVSIFARLGLDPTEGPLLGSRFPTDDAKPYSPELTTPPLNWLLPSEMAKHLETQTGVSFARFAQDTQACFNDGSKDDKLDGINDTVKETTVEAVVDSTGRPYALWVRTPEPVDWRRVSAALRIHHVNQTGNCPNSYAYRKPLDLKISILPSPDASSSFLVGSLEGLMTQLPRGEYDLTLSFDPYLEALPRLRPNPDVATLSEVVKIKFLQPFGLDWPLPSTHIKIPIRLIERLSKIYNIDQTLLLNLYEDPEIDPFERTHPPSKLEVEKS